MNDPRKAGALILNNIGMFNEATLLMTEKIEVELFKKIEEEIEQWQEKSRWNGKGDWTGDHMWVCPPAWGIDIEDDSCKAYFEFSYEKGDLDAVQLASFCGHGSNRVGFWFCIGNAYLGNTRQWRNFCKGSSLPAAASELQKLGFTYDKENWFLPVTLSSTDLAAAYEDEDYAEALQPICLALEQLKTAQPIFDEIIKAAELVLKIEAPALS